MEVAGFIQDQCRQGSGSISLSFSWPSPGCKMPATLSYDCWLKIGAYGKPEINIWQQGMEFPRLD